MTNEEKSKWLVENVLNSIWKDCYCHKNDNPDFYTTDLDQQAINFFKLWRAIQESEKFNQFFLFYAHQDNHVEYVDKSLISCSAFADAIGDYFNWEKGNES